MTKRSFHFALALILFALGGAGPRLAHAQESFFKGKTIRIVVGFSAGGGYDLYARAIARHMSRHIPGNPTIVVENMAGAASMISANHVYKVAKPDGLTIGHFIGGLFLQQVLGRQGIEFDARKFEYLGVPIKDTYCIGLTKASGITSMESWLAAKAPVKIGGTAPGSATDDIPAVLQAALGLPLQVVSGYKGTADIRLAADSGEVAGFTTGWESFKSTWRKALETGDAFIAVQAVAKPHPELPKVPLAINYAKTEVAKKLIQVGAQDPGILARPFVLPPGTPKDRVQMLRKAFMDTFNDPEFLAEAKKTNLDIGPLSGEEIARTVENLFKLEAPVIERLKKILLPK
jgi:tripartite-type tricarboxylate transporter receptor subunit TctC